jgi:hypothetical protein
MRCLQRNPLARGMYGFLTLIPIPCVSFWHLLLKRFDVQKVALEELPAPRVKRPGAARTWGQVLPRSVCKYFNPGVHSLHDCHVFKARPTLSPSYCFFH